jgi:ATP-dependent Clp protease adapter protein ClpS
MVSLAEAPVARKKRTDATVKIDVEVLRKAKVVAAIRDVTLAEYLTEVLRPIVEKDHARAIADEAKPRR